MDLEQLVRLNLSHVFKSIEEDYIHPTVGLKVPDEECDLDYTLEPVTDRKVNYVMSNSLGFGGHNATLLVKKFED